MQHFDRITQNPEVMGGKASVRGLRVTVGMIVGQIGAGHSIEEVLADYPYLEREDILQALRYAAWRADARDTEIMDFARTNGYVVLTHDLDFSAILAATHGDKPSVAQIRADDVSPSAIGVIVTKALQRMRIELENGAVLTIDPTRMRLRLLPVQP